MPGNIKTENVFRAGILLKKQFGANKPGKHPTTIKSNFMVTPSKPKSKTAKKILIVEDEGQTGLLLNMILSEREFDMDYVNSLLAADEYLEKNNPSVIILDNKLPDGYGVDFISYLRKKYPSIKIIMISGFSTARDVALANGADMFIEKPFSMDKVIEAIDAVLT